MFDFGLSVLDCYFECLGWQSLVTCLKVLEYCKTNSSLVNISLLRKGTQMILNS